MSYVRSIYVLCPGVIFFVTIIGYKYMKGQVLQSEELKVLYEGLKENEIDYYSHVLTGKWHKGTLETVTRGVLQKKSLKETPSQAFFCGHCEKFNSTYFEEHLQVTASGTLNWNLIQLYPNRLQWISLNCCFCCVFFVTFSHSFLFYC